MPVEIPQIEETGCLGAALMAMVGNQVFSDSKQAQQVVSAQVKRIEPDQTAYDKYQNKYKKYKLLLESLSHFNNHLND